MYVWIVGPEPKSLLAKRSDTLRVSELLSIHDLGSSPTIQSYITKLVLKGFVVRKISDEDKRVQFLVPTENAITLFDQLSKAIYDERIVAST